MADGPSMLVVKCRLPTPLGTVEKLRGRSHGLLCSRKAPPQRRMAWVVPCAHGTATIWLWSFDVQS